MHLTMFLKNNLLSIFLIALMSSSALCLKCQVCNSAEPDQGDCLIVEPADTKYLQDCEGPRNVSCRTQEQWIDFEVLKQAADKRVIRQCASSFEPNRQCYYRTGFGGKTSVCNCLGDGCNSAARTASALLMTIGAFLLLKMFH